MAGGRWTIHLPGGRGDSHFPWDKWPWTNRRVLSRRFSSGNDRFIRTGLHSEGGGWVIGLGHFMHAKILSCAYIFPRGKIIFNNENKIYGSYLTIIIIKSHVFQIFSPPFPFMQESKWFWPGARVISLFLLCLKLLCYVVCLFGQREPEVPGDQLQVPLYVPRPGQRPEHPGHRALPAPGPTRGP